MKDIYNDIVYLFGTELAMPDVILRKIYEYVRRGMQLPPSIRAENKICNLDRDVALLSMNRDKILDYANKYGVDIKNLPNTEEGFWAAVHIAVSSVESLPMEKRTLSKRWLLDRNMEVLDDGKVPV